mmetsp:Transcript_19763/g.54425  ORF Transcript_19763/g.54425 Transcript_19763/m.54425 type:complete len:256 (+) Transcript_19763:1069-1836(+)
MVQWACSKVYFKNRMRFSPRSSSEKVGTVWKRLQPTETSIASPLFSIFGYHLCRLTRSCTKPRRDSPASSPPSITGRSRRISATQAAGTSSSLMRTNVAIGTLSPKPSMAAPFSAAAASPPAPSPVPAAFSPSGAAAFFSASAPSSPSSSSSALLQPPVMNFSVFNASFRASSHGSDETGNFAMRDVSKPLISPRFPRRTLRLDRASAGVDCVSPAASSSSSPNSGIVAWSVGATTASSSAVAREVEEEEPPFPP